MCVQGWEDTFSHRKRFPNLPIDLWEFETFGIKMILTFEIKNQQS